jgi:hypothetical protein
MCYGRIDCPNRPLITQTLGVVPEQVGLGFLKGVRAGVGVLGKVFGLPTSTVGDALLEKAQSALGVVGAGHVDYMCVTEAASEYASSSGPVSQQQLSQFQEHEFGEFLKEYDPREEWRKELTRVALKQSGKVLWVCADALGQLEDEGQLTQPPPLLPLGDYGASGTRKILCSCVAWMVIATLSSYVADCGLAGVHELPCLARRLTAAAATELLPGAVPDSTPKSTQITTSSQAKTDQVRKVHLVDAQPPPPAKAELSMPPALAAALQANGLTPTDAAKLGVTSLEDFETLEDQDFVDAGIDIGACRNKREREELAEKERRQHELAQSEAKRQMELLLGTIHGVSRSAAPCSGFC